MKNKDKLKIFLHWFKCWGIFLYCYSKYDDEVNYVICEECGKELYNKWKNKY